jgi:hypothetical protein
VKVLEHIGEAGAGHEVLERGATLFPAGGTYGDEALRARSADGSVAVQEVRRQGVIVHLCMAHRTLATHQLERPVAAARALWTV